MSTESPGPPEGATVHTWLAESMPRDVRQRIDQLRASEGIDRIVVLPDVHLSRQFCIGTVVASRERLYPEAVGGDIGCGMAAVRFDAAATDVIGDGAAADRVLHALRRVVPTRRHGKRTVRPALPQVLDHEELSSESLAREAERDGRFQLGTLGSGNHFLELQTDDEGWLWLMVHSGSRAIGQAIARRHLKECATEPGGLRWLAADSREGQAYVSDVRWARRYAHHNRLDMIEAVEAILAEMLDVTMSEGTLITGDHNHVRREEHGGQMLWVHRKGALSAREDEPGIVPGSMGTESYHTVGRGHPDSLCSSSHGAGRVMSRSEARERISTRDLNRQMRNVWFDEGAASRLRDEAPGAYKDVREVMKAQKELTKIVRRVRPVLVYKG